MADESVVQTVQRNLTPEQDSSRSALGPGHQFDSGDSPQQAGEQQYKDKLGTPLEQAYGKAKAWLSEHEQHLSEETLKPFRQGLDKMADDLEEAGSTGHTKSGGAMNPATRALASGTGELLRAVPVGKDVKSTVQAAITPPEISTEEREALTAEQELALSKLDGHKIVEAPPEFAYRARPVGQKNVSAGERPVATSSLEKANTYKENLESMTGQPHEVVHIPLKGTSHTIHSGPNEGEKWYSFKKDVPEENLKTPAKPKEGGSGGGKPPNTPKKPPAPEEKDSPKKIIEDAGLKYKGELSKGSGVHMFEHPDHPGKTAALNEDQITPKNVKEKMASKLKEFGVKPTKFGDSDVVKKTDAAKGLKEPRNESKIVVEGVDDKKPEGKYSDRIKIDPFSPSYKPPATNKKQVTTT
jgi:hypothetical protein